MQLTKKEFYEVLEHIEKPGLTKVLQDAYGHVRPTVVACFDYDLKIMLWGTELDGAAIANYFGWSVVARIPFCIAHFRGLKFDEYTHNRLKHEWQKYSRWLNEYKDSA